ncbi:MAG: substrate-binding domain-containing protein, partial [Actinomycetota bacterium]
LAERDRSLLVATSDGTRELAAAERLAAHGVDALLITRRTGRDPIDPDAFEVPVVLVDSGAVDGVDTVRVDHAAGIAQIVRFLVREGAQRLAFVGEGSLSNVGTEQLEGFASATSAISEVETVALRLGPSTHEFAATTARELIGSPSPPDAYVCGSDLVASTLSAAFDVDDPERPLVVGYGAEPHSELVVPTLTTARLPIAEVAEEAVRLVMQRVDGLESDPIDIALAPSLVVGQSA